MGICVPAKQGRGRSSFATQPAAAPRSDGSMHCVRQDSGGRRVLIVDLNNFATFPTLAVGILVASLRDRGHDVHVVSPLAHDVPAVQREGRETLRHHFARRIHLSTAPAFTMARDGAREIRSWWQNRPHATVLRETVRALEAAPDVIMLSAYLQHYVTVAEIGKLARARNVPLLLGGPMFNVRGTADAWLAIPGLKAIVGAEADLMVSDIVEATCEDQELLAFPGVVMPDRRRSCAAPPLRELDRTPIPDFADFPWDRYPFRVIPLMTGRGCQWNRCVFCSDVVSASGRTFRTRSVESVMNEMREQARRHATANFLFLDLKLNSSPAMFRGIAENVQSVVPGARWIGTVHVDLRQDNGLSPRDLRQAVSSGMRRVSFGLESGSQRLLDAMDKGSSVEANSAFIRNAHEAGLSIRCTMFKGFPGETAADLEETAAFLERHAPYLDRVRFNEFSLLEDTPIYNALRDGSNDYPQFTVNHLDHRNARARYANRDGGGRAYRRAKARVLRCVYEINRREIRRSARAFDGLM